ncbi:MAG: hypothetical protein A2Y40_09835 [Candidatus Margulisbacteria bacterium GWF2_35_9]|nr:MAG: hypothetical protein A2Y40_09835 [Candidatus Margulisbacteria bacterium GWF2_35_9]
MDTQDLELIINTLNPQQQEAVLYTDGPLLILAGAGSGKTRVLTNKIAYLNKQFNVPLYNILAVTFTNKAAKEMQERVEKILGTSSAHHSDQWITTFHSLAFKILQRHSEAIGYQKGLVIYDSSDQVSLIKKILIDMDIDIKTIKPRAILNGISNAKNSLITPETLVNKADNSFKETVAEAYTQYQKKLLLNNAMDFDDLLLNLLKLFKEHDDILSIYQKKFQYVLIDEYQDINMPQYMISYLLSSKHKRIYVVGDADQNIYSWRGANLQNILNFEKDYPGAKTILLEQNYRSTGTILNISNEVIKHNKIRKDKNLWTENAVGEKAECFIAHNEYDEAEHVARQISQSIHAGTDPNEIAILYRTNAMSRVLEESMMQLGIKYKIFGGLRFYERKEIKDILAYMRLILNPSDDIALIRIINVPQRKIGKLTIQKLMDKAFEEKKPIMEVIDTMTELRSIQSVQTFRQEINKLRLAWDAGTMTLTDLIMKIFEDTGYKKMLKEEGTQEAQTRSENIQELCASTQESQYTLEEFLSLSALLTSQDEAQESDSTVTLMTLHSAKGLEYDHVYLVGFEEKCLPHVQSLDIPTELEEERRLCYVGMTRARISINLSVASYRSAYYEKANPQDISRFFREIPKDLLNIQLSKKLNTFNHIVSALKDEYDLKIPAVRSIQLVRNKTHYDEDDKNVSYNYNVGDIVTSPMFGEGQVIKTIGQGNAISLQIKFPQGSKLIMPKYGKLTKVE